MAFRCKGRNVADGRWILEGEAGVDGKGRDKVRGAEILMQKVEGRELLEQAIMFSYI